MSCRPATLRHWRSDPFAAEIRDGVLYGRGAADMKSAIAAFVAAAARHLAEHGKPNGSISLLITGDEEGPSINGTKAMLGWLKEKGETLDHCVVGEPTSTARSGDTIKIGRRGSMQIRLAVRGVQGHTAYPQNALNPIPILAEIVDAACHASARFGHRAFRAVDARLHDLRCRQSGLERDRRRKRAPRATSASTICTRRKRCKRHVEQVASNVVHELGGEASIDMHGRRRRVSSRNRVPSSRWCPTRSRA